MKQDELGNELDDYGNIKRKPNYSFWITVCLFVLVALWFNKCTTERTNHDEDYIETTYQ